MLILRLLAVISIDLSVLLSIISLDSPYVHCTLKVQKLTSE